MLSDKRYMQAFIGVIISVLVTIPEVVFSGYLIGGQALEFLNMGFLCLLSPVSVCAAMIILAFICAKTDTGVILKTFLICRLISIAMYVILNAVPFISDSVGFPLLFASYGTAISCVSILENFVGETLGLTVMIISVFIIPIITGVISYFGIYKKRV